MSLADRCELCRRYHAPDWKCETYPQAACDFCLLTFTVGVGGKIHSLPDESVNCCSRCLDELKFNQGGTHGESREAGDAVTGGTRGAQAKASSVLGVRQGAADHDLSSTLQGL